MVKIIKSSGRTSFDITEHKLKECIKELWTILDNLIPMKLMSKQKYEFESEIAMRRWYERIFGKRHSNKDFVRWKKNFASLRDQRDNDRKRRDKKNLKTYSKITDSEIDRSIKKLKCRYKDILSKYPAIILYMIDSVIYPKYLRSIEETAPKITPNILWRVDKNLVYVGKKRNLHS